VRLGAARDAGRAHAVQRLGGREAIKGVVDDFVANLAADRGEQPVQRIRRPKIAKIQTTSRPDLRRDGRPCAYLGRDMKTVHKGMNITEAEWSATWRTWSRRQQVQGAREGAAELLAIIGPMKKDIVGQ